MDTGTSVVCWSIHETILQRAICRARGWRAATGPQRLAPVLPVASTLETCMYSVSDVSIFKQHAFLQTIEIRLGTNSVVPQMPVAVLRVAPKGQLGTHVPLKHCRPRLHDSPLGLLVRWLHVCAVLLQLPGTWHSLAAQGRRHAACTLV